MSTCAPTPTRGSPRVGRPVHIEIGSDELDVLADLHFPRKFVRGKLFAYSETEEGLGNLQEHKKLFQYIYDNYGTFRIKLPCLKGMISRYMLKEGMLRGTYGSKTTVDVSAKIFANMLADLTTAVEASEKPKWLGSILDMQPDGVPGRVATPDLPSWLDDDIKQDGMSVLGYQSPERPKRRKECCIFL